MPTNKFDEIKRRVSESRKSTTSSWDRIIDEVSNARQKNDEATVDEQYMRKFFSDTESYLSRSEYALNNMSWNEAMDSGAKSRRNETVTDLTNRANAINRYLSKNNSNTDIQGKISEYLDAINKTSVAFDERSKYFSNWKSQDEYDTAARQYGYSKKYEGKTSTELQALIDSMEDGEEKEWLKTYASTVDHDEKAAYDLEAAQKEIEKLEKQKEDLFQKYRGILASNQSATTYLTGPNGSPQTSGNYIGKIEGEESDVIRQMKDLDDEINQKKQYLNLADRVQYGIKLSSVADPNSKNYDPEFNNYTGYVADVNYELGGKPYFDDETYAYINNPTVTDNRTGGEISARDLLGWNETAMSKNSPYYNGLKAETIFDFMTDDEIDIYNYYYNKHGKDAAKEYIEYLSESLNARKAQKDFEKYYEGNKLLELGHSITAGLDQFGSGIANLGNGDDYIPTTYSQYLSSMVREDLADVDLKWYNFKEGEWDDANIFGSSFGQTLYDVGTTTANMAPSILVSAAVDLLNPVAGAWIGATLMGASAAGNAYADALNRGLDKSQAATYGVAIGVSEALLEKALGGISKFGGTSAKITKAVSGIDDALLRWSLRFGGSFASEALEEGLQEILDPIFQNAIFGTDEDVNWSEVAYSALLGGLSAGVFELGGTIKQTKVEQSYKAKYDGSVDELIKEGLESDINSESFQLATQYKEKTDAKKNLTGAEIRNLVEANERQFAVEDFNTAKSTAEKRLTELGESNNIKKIAELAAKRATGQKLTRSEKSTLARSRYGAQVAKEMQREAQPDNGSSKPFDTSYKITYKSLDERIGTEGRFGVSDTGKSIVRDTGKEVDIDTLKFKKITEDGKVKLVDPDGTVVDAAWVDWADDGQSYLVSAVSAIENITPESATDIIRLVDRTKPLGAQMNAIDEAFTYGYRGYSESELVAGEYTDAITNEQLKKAYELGKDTAKNRDNSKAVSYEKMRTAAQAQAEKATADGKKAPKPKNLTITYNKGNGKVVSIDEAGVIEEKRSGGVKAAKILHELGLGTKVEFFESFVSKSMMVENKKTGKMEYARVFINDQGKEQIAYSGVYRQSDGTIRIDLNAYNGRGLTLYALSHELTHFIQQWSDKKYKVLADFLVKTYEGTDMTMHKRVLREQKRLEDIRGKDKVSYDEAFDEVVANAMSKMFDDGKLVERLTELKAQDEKLARKLWEGFKKIMSKFLGIYQANRAISDDAADLVAMKNTFEQLQNMFAEALVEASDNYQASLIAQEAVAIESLGENAKVETNADGELLIASNENGNVLMYSEHTYLDGGREKLEMALRQNGHTEAEIEQTLSYVDDALDYIKILAAGYAKQMGYTSLSNHLVAEIVTNVKTGKQVMSAIVNNGDYPVNIDLSLICKKRVAYMNLMSRLIRDGVFDKVNYDGAAIAEVNEILRNNGFETACLGCFVESRRLQFQTWAETIVSEWNAEVEKRNPNAEAFGFAQGKMESLTDADIDALTQELESVKKNDQGNVNLGQGNSVTRMGRLLDALPSLQKKLTVEDLLTPEGLTALRKHDGSLFSIVKSRYGAASPKIVQDFNPYASEIAMLTFAQVKGITNNAVKGAQAYVTAARNEYAKPQKVKGESKANFDKRKKAYEQRVQDEAMRRYLYDIGGARIQSFSDFMIENIFDYIQIFADLAAKRLPLHGYSKEIVCLRLFGMTGAKWNGSLIAHVERSMGKEYAGLLPAGTKGGIPVNIDGKDYVIGFDDYARNADTDGKSFIQSIGMKDIIALQLDPRYSPYVGSITIGVSDMQILAMLESPLFRMVIPYHASGMLPMFAKLVGVDMYNDYTDYQNTTVRQYYDLNGNAVSELKNAKGETVKADTSYAYNAEIQKTKDAKTAANNYLKWCAQRHPVYDGSTLVGYATFNPKFSSSPFGTDFTRHENYYKLLEDFNTYDCITEESAVQGDVKMNFPSEENRLTKQQMAEYKAALRETGIFTEKDIEKYAKKADMTFKEIIAAEVGNRANYAATQAPKWESTVKEVEAKLQKDYAREQYSSQETDLDTEGMSDEAKAIIKNLEIRAMGSRYLKGKYASYSTERIDRELAQSSATKMDYAKSYIAWVNPDEFLYATTTSYEGRVQIEKEAGELDLDRLRKQTQPIHLTVDFETGKIVGHEGRHRMTALRNAGVEKVAVIFDAWNDDRYNTKPVDMMRIGGQEFGRYHSGIDFFVHDMLPLSRRYADAARKLFSEVDGSVRYSEHDTDYSNRSLLANAFETLSQNSKEYKMIQEYKGRIRLLNEQEEKLSKLNAEIWETRFGKGKYDAEKLKQLEAKAKNVAEEITRQDRKLLDMEASEPLRKVIEQERRKEAQKTKEHVREIQQNKKLRAEQAEYRHKIRKTVRDLDKLLNRGNKKTNVKEDMKGFVSKALELADFIFTDHVSNDDLIRKGITVRMTPREEALVRETEDILTKIYDDFATLTAEEFTDLDDKRKRNMEKLRDLLTSQRNERLKTPVYNLFNDLVAEYASLKNSKQDAVKAAYDPSVEMILRNYIGESNGETDSDRVTLLKNMRVADMTTKELENLYYAYKIVLTSVRNANKLHIQGKAESIQQVADSITRDFTQRKTPDKTVATVVRNISNKMGWDYEKLYYALDRIGSEAFTELVMNIANSENIVMQDVIEAAMFRDEMVEKYGFNKWDVNKKIDREFLDTTGKKFELTLGQLMSLYAYSRRKGAWDHIEYGGFVFGEKALTNPKPADSYKLTKDQCEAITNTLTKEQKGYVEDMQKFLSETMGEKGNEVSMLLYGIKMFGEKNYFPIHVAGEYMANAQESKAKEAAGFSSMTSAGFTKAQNPNAKAPFVLEGFNEIWADHVNEMSRYHGTVPALEDFRRVMNRSTYSDSTADSISLRALMENSYGKEAVDYFDNLYKEANSGAIRDKLEKKSQKLLSLFRKNSVAYSLSVLIQQPASIVRAYALIDKKYFGIKGFGAITSGVAKAVSDRWTKAHTNAYNEMLKYAPGVTMAKEIGGFDTATGGSIRSYLLDTDKGFFQSMKTENLKGKAGAAMDLVDDNAIANLPNLADKIAWIEIWNACKRETAAKHKDLATSSEEFMKIVGERFTEVIRATQVYDSIFAKSPMLKSKNPAVQYLVSFMNEPNAVANMAESAVRDATRGNWKGGVRKAGTVIYSIIFTNVLKSLIYAMRDDDEEETYIEKYIEAITGGLMDDFNALNYIPLVRDVWSVAQGYDVERADMAIVSDFFSALTDVIKNATKDTSDMTKDELAEFEKKSAEATWQLVGSLASFFGIPVKNVRREIKGVLDHARIASANAGMTTAQSAWDKIQDSVIEWIPFMQNDRTKGDKLYDAIINGDKSYLDRLKGTYSTDNAYQNAVRKALRENDSRIKEAALAEINGNPSERVRIQKLIMADGFDQDDVVAATNSEIADLTPDKEDSGTDKKKGFYTTENFVREFVNGDTTSAKTAKSDIISTAIANGKTKEQAEKDFMSNVSSSAKKAYEDGWLTESKTKKLLVEYAGEDEEGAASKVNYWTLSKLYPKYKDLLNESRTENYYEYVKPAGISMDTYAKFLTKTNGLANKYDKYGNLVQEKIDQVKDVIHSLPLTRRQKNALYLAAGYAESGLDDVPW